MNDRLMRRLHSFNWTRLVMALVELGGLIALYSYAFNIIRPRHPYLASTILGFVAIWELLLIVTYLGQWRKPLRQRRGRWVLERIATVVAQALVYTVLAGLLWAVFYRPQWLLALIIAQGAAAVLVVLIVPVRWRQWFPPLPPEKQAIVYLVRTGDYDLMGKLTEPGRDQARQAAARIRALAGNNPVVVLDPVPPANRECYRETAQIIAVDLGVVLRHQYHLGLNSLPAPRSTNLDSFERDDLARLQHQAWGNMPRKQQPQLLPDLRVVMVIDGSRLNSLLAADLPGPRVEGGNELGPPHGSVHQLVVTYDRKTGQITERRFVSEPVEPLVAPAT
jgi:hypothetical protein